MKNERSYGLIPLRKRKDKWQILLVKHGKGHWGFPKGHAEKGERPEETAEREFKEETGLSLVKFLDFPHLEETYIFTWEGVVIKKTVVYFLAEAKGKITVDPKEISEAKWLDLDEAEKLASFPEMKRLCQEIAKLLKISEL